MAVGVGSQVNAGTQIGTVGQTGSATGAHLHYEQRFNNAGRLPIRFDGSPIDVGSSPPGPTFTSSNCGTPPPQGIPFGSFDSVSSPANGKIAVRGWAIDPDAKTAHTVKLSHDHAPARRSEYRLPMVTVCRPRHARRSRQMPRHILGGLYVSGGSQPHRSAAPPWW